MVEVAVFVGFAVLDGVDERVTDCEREPVLEWDADFDGVVE